MVLVLALCSFGCQAFNETSEEHDDGHDLPEVISVKSPASGDHYSDDEVIHEFDMCNVVSLGDSVVLGEVTNFIHDTSTCEERPYRNRHDEGRIEIIDTIVGEEFGGSLDVVWFGGTTYYDGWSEGQLLLLSVHEVGGVLFVTRELAVKSQSLCKSPSAGIV